MKALLTQDEKTTKRPSTNPLKGNERLRDAYEIVNLKRASSIIAFHIVYKLSY